MERLLQVEELKQHKHVLREKLIKLQEDFKYNLELLDGRDRDLELLETQVEAFQAEVKQHLAEKQELGSQLQQLFERKHYISSGFDFQVSRCTAV